jgi:hypothetical protein
VATLAQPVDRRWFKNPVSPAQQLFCSLTGTAFWTPTPLRRPVRLKTGAEKIFIVPFDFEPGGPLDHTPSGLFLGGGASLDAAQPGAAIAAPANRIASSLVQVAHPRAGAWNHRRALLLRKLGHHCLGRDEKARNGSCVLERRAHHLGGVDDALRDQIAEFAGLRVIAVGVAVLVQDIPDYDRAVFARVGGNLAGRPR